MVKQWVEGGYFEEYSGKWGWKNKNRERTKGKWLKKSLKVSEKFGNLNIQEKWKETYTKGKRTENSKVTENWERGRNKMISR